MEPRPHPAEDQLAPARGCLAALLLGALLWGLLLGAILLVR